jgi:shikimate dehydrogenase
VTDRYAAFGNPMGHAKSPRIHALFAEQTGEDLRYDAIEAPLDGFAAAVDAFRAAGGRGINVTLPFKVEAFAYATERAERARGARSVNCIRFEGSRAIGENFDGVGLVRDIVRNLGIPIRGRRVLVLGAGGAARGLVLPLLQEKPVRLVVANRTVAKATELGEWFAKYGPVATAGYGELTGQSFDIVVNATSASFRGERPPVPKAAFAPGCLAYDLFYAGGLTPFLGIAREAGALRLANGVGMLVEQAAEAFAWWRGVRPETGKVIEALAVPMG